MSREFIKSRMLSKIVGKVVQISKKYKQSNTYYYQL